MKALFTAFALMASVCLVTAQKVGVNTDNPQAVMHVYSAGQVLHPDGLLMLGNKSEAHMVGDFNYLQSLWSDQGTTLNMYLQPSGGNLGVNVPLNGASFAPLHVFGEGVNTSTYGIGLFGNRVLKHLVIDHDRIQARNNNTEDKLYLQAAGGDLDLAGGTMVVDHSLNTVGIGDNSPTAALDIISNGNTSATRAFEIRNSTFGNLFQVRDDGNVGIGTSVPNYDLHVIGDVAVSHRLRHANDDDTFLEFTSDKATIDVGGKEFIDMTESTNGQDRIDIGTTDVDVNLSNKLYVDYSSSRIGIGTTAPDYTLDINGSLGVNFGINHNGDPDTYVEFGTDYVGLSAGGNTMLTVTGSQDRVSMGGVLHVDDSQNRVGIGSALHVGNPDSQLHIKQNDAVSDADQGLRFERTGSLSYWRLAMGSNWFHWYYNGVLKAQIETGDGSWNSSSDRRLKRDIESLPSLLDRIGELRPVSYHLKDDANPGPYKRMGFIAQEVDEVFPEAVRQMDDHLGLTYDYFGVIAIKGIQELVHRNELLESRVGGQQAQIQQLQAENTELEERLAKLEAAVAGFVQQSASSN